MTHKQVGWNQGLTNLVGVDQLSISWIPQDGKTVGIMQSVKELITAG